MRKQCLIALVFAGLIACDDTSGRSYARQIESPNELIGGPGALGTVGDYLIGNQKIRVIIQNEGWSRGFGIFRTFKSQHLWIFDNFQIFSHLSQQPT